MRGDTGLRDVGRYRHKLVPALGTQMVLDSGLWSGAAELLDTFLTTSHGHNTSPPHHDDRVAGAGGWGWEALFW